MITKSSNWPIQKVDRSSSWLAIQTHYVLALLEPLQIMLLSVNIGLGSFREKNLDVYVITTRLNQDDIFFMSISDSMTTEIQEETLLVISSCFWCWIQMHFHFATCQDNFLPFSFLPFSLSLSCSFVLLYVVTKVATMVCLCAPCNKLLI